MSAVLVTGATGFIGIELVRELAHRGYDVHGVARDVSAARNCGLPVARWYEADLLDGGSLACAVRAFREGVEGELSLVHGAAVISYRTADADLQRRANVAGTIALVDAARDSGVRRFVHVSSVVAVGVARSPDEELDEEASFNAAPLRCDYVDTKRAAEEAALAASVPGFDVIAVNPGAVFGASTRYSNTQRFMATLGRYPIVGLLAPPGGVSVVGLKDVASGIASALERGRAGRRYLLCESNLRLVELYGLVFERFGRGRVLGACPLPSWQALCAVVGGIDRLRPSDFATPQALRLLGVHFRTRSDRARTELDWNPVPFETVLEETLASIGSRAASRAPRRG